MVQNKVTFKVALFSIMSFEYVMCLQNSFKNFYSGFNIEKRYPFIFLYI